MTARPIVVVGAGGHGREVRDIIVAAGLGDRFAGFVDDGAPDVTLLERQGARLLGGIEMLDVGAAVYLIAIGDPSARARLDHDLSSAGADPFSVIHPTAAVGPSNALGPGLVVWANASITTNVSFGRHVHVNQNATIAHDCVLGDYVTISPGANVSGNVTLGDRVTVGTGAAIIQGVTIGEGATVGAGAVVTSDLAPHVVAVGVPARPR